MTVLVVGGSGGIGSAIVQLFAGAGETVRFTFLKAERSARRIEEEVSATGGEAVAVQLDCRNTEALAEAVTGCGEQLKTVVFAAATGVQRQLKDAKLRHADFVYQANQRAFFALCGIALPQLASTRGSLIALTSVGSRRVLPDYALVGAAKAAIETLVRYAAFEYAGAGVRVNAVCPGLVETKALNSFPEIGRRLRATVGATPLGRLVEPEEVAEVVMWLASDRASMITGQTIVIDGGWEVGNATGPVQ